MRCARCGKHDDGRPTGSLQLPTVTIDGQTYHLLCAYGLGLVNVVFK